jgi:hypothetical protein
VWVGNRGHSSLVHVGLVEGDQCVDRNGNGTIDTSTGYGNILAWPGGGYGASDPVSAAQDECILHYVDTYGGDVRHLSVNGDGDVWAGNMNDNVWPGTHRFQLIDDVTGTIVRSADMPCGGYGGIVDGNGVLWSATPGTAVLRWDPNAPNAAGVNPRCISMPNYGLAFDSLNNIWVSNGRRVCRQ